MMGADLLTSLYLKNHFFLWKRKDIMRFRFPWKVFLGPLALLVFCGFAIVAVISAGGTDQLEPPDPMVLMNELEQAKATIVGLERQIQEMKQDLDVELRKRVGEVLTRFAGQRGRVREKPLPLFRIIVSTLNGDIGVYTRDPNISSGDEMEIQTGLERPDSFEYRLAGEILNAHRVIVEPEKR
jgi:hypothetical protein